jgi:predicted metal-dependent hydrolase
LVLKRSDEASSVAALLSSTADLIEGHIDAVATNGAHWGARLALIAALSHFPKLEPELKLLGSRRNADLTESQMEALWIWTHWASEALPLSVLPSIARNSPDDADEE